MVNKNRIQFDLEAKETQQLDRHVEETITSGRSNFIRDVTVFYIWAIEEAKSGRSVGSMDSGSKNFKEAVFPAFLRINPSKTT